jgi:2-oxoglutarate ferredoxin oxidoreductase subunit gamma
MARTEIRIAGFGGQGVILTGYIFGKAASLFDVKYATLIQSFGPEARGSACSAQVIVSDELIDYPYLRKPDILITLSQEAYSKYAGELNSGGVLITEEDMVVPDKKYSQANLFSVPATRIADQLGRRIVMNMVVVGFFTAVTGLLDKEAMKKAVEDSIPKGTEELNLKAFEEGYAYGMQKVHEKDDTSINTSAKL